VDVVVQLDQTSLAAVGLRKCLEILSSKQCSQLKYLSSLYKFVMKIKKLVLEQNEDGLQDESHIEFLTLFIPMRFNSVDLKAT